MRLSWVQPEDLLGHELRQAAEEGKDTTEIQLRWCEAGGRPAPASGASRDPAGPEVRAMAVRLLDELALVPTPLPEPTDLDAIRLDCPQWTEQVTAVPQSLGERLHGAWLGRAVGCLLGKPVEKIPRKGIREIGQATGNWPPRGYFTAVGLPAEVAARWPWNRRSAATSLAENIDGMPEDDDLNYAVLALLLVERHGRVFTTDHVAQLWLDELPAGRTFTAERIAYRNLLLGITPPRTARVHNPFREWIGAQIRADVHGWTNPGRPGAAAAQAWRDAVLSHTANGVYGAMFVAAVSAAACVVDEPVECVRIGLSVVPEGSRMAEAIGYGMRTAEREPNWELVVDRIYRRYGHLHWVHAINNTALVVAALVHGGGEFERSICSVVSGGWDTDSNGATVGAVLGALGGTGALPKRWTEPLRNRLSTTVAGIGSIGFDVLAERTRRMAEHRRE